MLSKLHDLRLPWACCTFAALLWKVPKASDAARARLQLFGGVRLRTPFNRMPQERRPIELSDFRFLVCAVGGACVVSGLSESWQDLVRARVGLAAGRVVLGAQAAKVARSALEGSGAGRNPWSAVAQRFMVEASKRGFQNETGQNIWNSCEIFSRMGNCGCSLPLVARWQWEGQPSPSTRGRRGHMFTRTSLLAIQFVVGGLRKQFCLQKLFMGNGDPVNKMIYDDPV